MLKKVIQNEEESSLSKYFKDVRKSVVLSVEDEYELAKKVYYENDKKAIEKLVNANLKFVVSIAKEYQNQGLSLADLISEGNYGLVKAATRFDPTKGFRFISYAVWWIRQSILQSLNENARTVRLPANIILKLKQLKREIEKFELENEREPIYGEILDENNEAVDLNLFTKCSSLNDVINEDGDELIDFLGDEENYDELFVDDRIKNQLNKTLEILDERERDIIECYFGINKDYESMTLEAIGEKYNLTKERIRQIKEKSLRKLRHNAQGLYSAMKE